MTRNLQILPECHADTLLIDMLGFKYPNHQASINNVANTMLKKYDKRLAIGIIDNDKKQPTYFKSFQQIQHKDGLILKKHPKQKHFLIIVSPVFEKWIFKLADSVEVLPSKYGFASLKQFQRSTKSIHVAKNQQVKQFINTLKQKKAKGMMTMIQWINDIQHNKIK